MKNRCIMAVIVVAVLSVSSISAAAMIDGSDVWAVRNVAHGFGNAEIESDGVGDPMISGKMNGTRYNIYFFGCKDSTNCSRIQFRAGFTDPHVSIRDLNVWNADKLFGRAYLDEEGDAIVEMTINLKYGVTEKNFIDTFEFWEIVLRDFREFVWE